jgi:hypothetical protein
MSDLDKLNEQYYYEKYLKYKKKYLELQEQEGGNSKYYIFYNKAEHNLIVNKINNNNCLKKFDNSCKSIFGVNGIELREKGVLKKSLYVNEINFIADIKNFIKNLENNVKPDKCIIDSLKRGIRMINATREKFETMNEYNLEKQIDDILIVLEKIDNVDYKNKKLEIRKHLINAIHPTNVNLNFIAFILNSGGYIVDSCYEVDKKTLIYKPIDIIEYNRKDLAMKITDFINGLPFTFPTKMNQPHLSETIIEDENNNELVNLIVNKLKQKIIDITDREITDKEKTGVKITNKKRIENIKKSLKDLLPSCLWIIYHYNECGEHIK